MPAGTRLLAALALASACTSAEVEYVAPPREDVVIEPGQTAVSLTFDDAFDTHARAAEIIEQHGLRGTFYLILGRLGGEGYLDLDQMRAIADRGHEVGAHTFTHRNLAELAPDEAERELCDARVTMRAIGFPAESVAYPFGASGPEVQAAAERCGYSSARSVGGLYDPESCTQCPVRETVVPGSYFDVLTPNSVIAATTLEMLQRSVTDAEEAGGGWVVFVFHHVCDDCSELEVSPALLDEFAAWLAGRDRVVVATVDQIVGGETRPEIAGPPPARDPPPEQLLANGELEAWTEGAESPDCWRFGGTGDEEWTRTDDAYAGQYAQHVRATGTPVKARLVSEQDMGTCATPVEPGQSFTFSARFKGSADGLPIGYVRDRYGDWRTWAYGSLIAPTDSWVEVTWDTPGIPDDATAISVGLSLITEGDATFDDFRLRLR
jgi:peptidoglycan/xylan/chitin deacetylase (PgdA/CDA1 family)